MAVAAAALRLEILARNSSNLTVSLWSPAISASLTLKAWSPPTWTGSGYGNGSAGGVIFLGGAVRNLEEKTTTSEDLGIGKKLNTTLI